MPFETAVFLAILMLLFPALLFWGANQHKKRRNQKSYQEYKTLITCEYCGRTDYDLNYSEEIIETERRYPFEEREVSTYRTYTIICKYCNKEIGQYTRRVVGLFDNSYGDLLGEINDENLGCTETIAWLLAYSFALVIYGAFIVMVIINFARRASF